MRDRHLQEYAREMRRTPTPAEQALWFELRAERFCGVKFRRQKVIGPYIVDFASRGPMLVVEVDGHSHGNRVDYDAKRTRYLVNAGYKVVRFTNYDVLENMLGTLESLALVIGFFQKRDEVGSCDLRDGNAKLPPSRPLPNTPLPTLSPEGERAN